jgi:hypothetical protein
MSNKSVQIIRRLMPAAVVAFGVAIVAMVQNGLFSPQAASVKNTTSTSSSLQTDTHAPTQSPHVKVNGRSVDVDKNGEADVSLPGGANAHVEVSGSHATVTTTNPSDNSTSSVGQNGDLDVTVQSNSTGGSSHSSTRVYGNTTTRGGSKSSSRTHVFSTGDAQVDVKTP